MQAKAVSNTKVCMIEQKITFYFIHFVLSLCGTIIMDKFKSWYKSLCQIIYALGGSVDEVLEIDREKQPVHMEADSKYSRFLEKDLRYERKSKFRVWVAFLVLVAINICMLLFDIFNPYVGYIRYQRQMAAYTGETASVVLCIVISKIKAATRI